MGFRPRQLHFQKNSGSPAEGNQNSLQGGREFSKTFESAKHGKHTETGGDCWDMRTVPGGNAVKTVGNASHVERTKHCTGGKHGKHKETGGDCWDEDIAGRKRSQDCWKR